ncbi:hypothetical protein QF002_000332 [Paraburkholderia youngii]
MSRQQPTSNRRSRRSALSCARTSALSVASCAQPRPIHLEEDRELRVEVHIQIRSGHAGGRSDPRHFRRGEALLLKERACGLRDQFLLPMLHCGAPVRIRIDVSGASPIQQKTLDGGKFPKQNTIH